MEPWFGATGPAGTGGAGGPAGGLHDPPAAQWASPRRPPAQGSPVPTRHDSSSWTPPCPLPCSRAPRPRPSSQMTAAPRQVGLESTRQASGGAPSASLRGHGSEPEATPGMGRAPAEAHARHRTGIQSYGTATGQASTELQDRHRVGTGRAGIQRGQCWAQGRHRVGIHRDPCQAQVWHPQSYRTGIG